MEALQYHERLWGGGLDMNIDIVPFDYYYHGLTCNKVSLTITLMGEPIATMHVDPSTFEDPEQVFEAFIGHLFSPAIAATTKEFNK